MIRLLLLIFCLLPAVAGAATVYKGEQTLWQETTWDGEVLIDGVVTVAPDVTLHIRPGTIIRFTRYDSNADNIGEHELFIQGHLRAQGTADRPIVFTSAEAQPRQGDWGALNMMAAPQDNLLEHCLIEYAYRGFHAHFAGGQLRDSTFRQNRRGAQFQESKVTIERCRFIDNLNGLQFRDSTVTISDSLVSGGYWGVRGVYSQVSVTGSRVEHNRINGLNLRDSQLDMTNSRISANRRGLYLQRSDAEVNDNILSGNSEYGLFVEQGQVRARNNRIVANGRGGIRLLDASPVLSDNRLGGNGLYALVNDGSNDLAVSGNDWGTTDPQAIAESIRDGADRPGCGRVTVARPVFLD